jgi:hypothetical protein
MAVLNRRFETVKEVASMPEYLQQKAFSELQETAEVRNNGLRVLRKLIEEDTSLTMHAVDDTFLLKFLRWGSFDITKAFDRVRAYYKYKLEYKDLFYETLPSFVAGMIEDGFVSVLPGKSTDDPVIVYMTFTEWNTEKYSYDDLVRSLFILAEKCLDNQQTQICGAVIIFDVTGYDSSLSHHFTQSNIVKGAKMYEEALPLRIKGLYVVHSPEEFRPVYDLYYEVYGKQIREKMGIYGTDLTELYKKIDRNSLPTEIGGKVQRSKGLLSVAKELREWEPVWKKYMQSGYEE